MIDFIDDFMRLAKRSNLTKIENQKVTRFVNGLKPFTQEKIRLQNMWSLQEAINMALKAEMMKKERRQASFRKNMVQHFENPIVSFMDKGKFVPQSSGRLKPSSFPSRASNGEIVLEFLTRGIIETNLYGCNKTGHQSNICLEWRQENLLEVVRNNEEEYEGGEIGDDDYANVEFAIEEGIDRLTLVLQRV